MPRSPEAQAQRAATLARRDIERQIAVTRSATALLPGDRCPVCRTEFHGRDGCEHSWADVTKANDRFLRSRLASV